MRQYLMRHFKAEKKLQRFKNCAIFPNNRWSRGYSFWIYLYLSGICFFRTSLFMALAHMRLFGRNYFRYMHAQYRIRDFIRQRLTC